MVTRALVLAGSAVVSALLLGGCVSAGQDAAEQAVERPEIDRRCEVFDGDALQRVLGQGFEGPVNTADSTRQIAECQWTASSQTALVLAKVSDGDGAFLFRESEEAASRTLGQVTPISVQGVKQAYYLPSLGRVGMLVDGRYVEVSVLVPGADPRQTGRLAKLAAAGIG
jgi:hypothetical protein